MENNNERNFLDLNIDQWGWISTATNGISVIVQMYTLYKTNKAESFSMKFIWMMTLLNFVYFIVGLLENNIGLALATFFFVVYNLAVVYVHHCGIGGSKVKGWFHNIITKFCKPK